MREVADSARLRLFFARLGAASERDTAVFVTGGATAVLLGWRQETLGADIHLVPESHSLLRALPRVSEQLRLNVDVVHPARFIPELPGWRERCVYITKQGRIWFYHYDLYAQALARIERGHEQDVLDVAALFERKLIEADRLLLLFESIAPLLYRYPNLDPARFRRRVIETVGRSGSSPSA